MDITIYPRKLSGTIWAIPSKSQAHRLLICSAFADAPTFLHCPQTNKDIEATALCLRAIGAGIERINDGYQITPIRQLPKEAFLPCGESGSTLRFLLPIIAALGVKGTFYMEGRLPQRPLSPLWELMEEKGCELSRPTADTIQCAGQLHSGEFIINGGVSSQYITGLLFALSLLKESSTICITGKAESIPYIQMTQIAQNLFCVQTEGLIIHGGQVYHSPGNVQVEGDWSNAAFFLTAQALGNSVQVENLNPASSQGDREIMDLLPQLKKHCIISAAQIPDLVPILSVAAASGQGCTFTDIGRLRLKESDRVEAVICMLHAMGIEAAATQNTLSVFPGEFRGGIIDSQNDHRIAMSAAIAATLADGPVTILNAQCVNKSYPTFWKTYSELGGHYEQYLR